MQSLSLEEKLELTIRRIRDWIKTYGEDGVYVSFSGGKDSTVLLDIVRKEYPDIKAVFFDTGLEYSEIREFVKTFDNVEWIKPKMNFRQVIEKYGYPFISKEVSEIVYGARRYLQSLDNEGGHQVNTDTDLTSCVEQTNTQKNTQNPVRGAVRYKFEYNKLTGQGKYGVQNSGRNAYLNTISSLDKGSTEYKILDELPERVKMLLGIYGKGNKAVTEDIPSKDKSPFNYERYKFFLEVGAPPISNLCCRVMKKSPAHGYQKKTGRNPMIASMAGESRLRTQQWLNNGCNGFDMKSPTSNPMAFWTEQDVLRYIYNNNLPICPIYGKIIEYYDNHGQITGQMDFSDFKVIEKEKPLLKTTGCERTGCIFCAYGLNRDKSPNRFEMLSESHPNLYDYVMRGGAFDENGDWRPDKNGLGYWYCIEWINKHGNFNIQYPNREYYLEKYMTEETKKYL